MSSDVCENNVFPVCDRFFYRKHVNFLILLRRLWYSEKLNSLCSDSRFIAVHYARKITKICLLFACRKICRISYLHCFRKHPMISVYLFYCASTMEHQIKRLPPCKGRKPVFSLTTFYSIRRISPLICVPFNGGYRQRLLNFIRSLGCNSRVMFIYLLLVFGFHLIRTLYNVHYALFMQGNYCLYQRFYYFIVLLDFFLPCYSNLTNISCQLF